MTSSVGHLKRAIDIAAGLVGLLLTLPLFPFIALAVYIDSPGPVFFRQRRAGRLLEVREGNQFVFAEFDMFKFRSMHTNAERLTGAVLAQEGDPRITKVGRFLRKSRLDELPQLLNVLKGDMSLVGPRPERPELLANLALAIPFFEERMRDVKPGVTGLAQISLGYSGNVLSEGTDDASLFADFSNPFGLDDADGADADDMRMKLLYDMAYVAALERMDTYLPMELSIMVKTPLVMLRGTGR